MVARAGATAAGRPRGVHGGQLESLVARINAPGRRRGARGFTLIELTVAIAVLLVAVLSTGVAQLSALRLQEGAKETTWANAALESAMESILAHSLDDLQAAHPADQPMPGFAAPGIADLRIVPTYPGWTTGAEPPDPLTIVVTATWTDRRGQERRDILRGMKTR